MELLKLILRNFRNHRKAEFNFSSGVTGISGTNGAGKSSIVEAILFLLTGDYYGESKQSVITTGEVTGYAIGHFKINGKLAILERHLDTSKVSLKYDGKVLKKSGEVNDLWDSLFQIDKHIMKNVVISKQKDIALLFSGDAAVREKLFQKIFMVPNTTRLRDIVWKDYIKNAPPLIPVHPTGSLEQTKTQTTASLTAIRAQLAATPDNTVDMEEALVRQAYLQKCLGSEFTVAIHEASLARLEETIAQLQAEVTAVSAYYNAEQHELIKKEVYTLDLLKPRVAKKEALQASMRNIERGLAECEATEQTRDEYAVLDQKIRGDEAILTALRAQYNKDKDRLAGYASKGLSAEVESCPTCGSEIHDLKTVIAHIQEDLAKQQAHGSELRAQLENDKRALEIMKRNLTILDQLQNSWREKQSSLDALEDLEYDADTHKEYADTLGVFDKLLEKKNRLEAELRNEENHKVNITVELAGTTAYDNRDTTAHAELLSVEARLARYKEQNKQRSELVVQESVTLRELDKLDSLIEKHATDVKINARRQRYAKVLEEIYDVLHTSKLPRLLIQTYANNVSVGMSNILTAFDFPYTVEVNDNFGIDVFDSSGNKLPSVSGGQEVMVGMSMRLAVHELFGGSFPFMIVDEGSDGLAPSAKKQYFDIIRNLKNMSKLKQIIVIDHDPALEDAVDNVLRL